MTAPTPPPAVPDAVPAPAPAPGDADAEGPRPRPSRRAEALAGLGVAASTALLGAPVGLLWAALAPHPVVRVAGGEATVEDPVARAFISGDLVFLALALAAGVAAGLVVALTLRRYGPGPVVGLALGALAAAEVARRTGHLVGLDDARALVRSGRDGRAQVAVRLRAWQALLAWPVGALATNLVGLIARREPAQHPDPGPWAPPAGSSWGSPVSSG